ncbi:MAG: hypothetical protein ACI8QZ_002673 [Chlamydiales bacterium]|jgi:hypothetical protein
MRIASLLLLTGATLLASSGCQSTPMVSLATDPPGAQIVIDGEDSGYVTPCVMTLANEGHRVDLILPGYSPATRYMSRAKPAQIILWTELMGNLHTWRFPLWLNYRDFFVPIEAPSGPFPRRMFVRLRRPVQS